MKLLSQFGGFVALMVFLSSCAVNPVTGKKELMLMSEKQEIAIGKNADPQIVAQYGLYQDQTIQSFIDRKGQEMAKVSHRPNLKYEFKVLDSDVVNAFALPGGYVYFTRGILAHFNNEAEFAGVLGHEIGHITARHSAKQQTKAQLAQVLFIGGMIASPAFRTFAQSAQQGLGLLFLKFGRDAESQSDRLGVEYSTKIGYDADQMANFFKTLKRMRGKSAQQIPTFLSTHPDPGDRYNKVKEKTKEWQAKDGKSPYDVNRDSYLRMIDGLMYGEDPNQGYVENDYFYHPQLKFQFPIPRDWRLANSPSQVQMAPKDGKAMMVMSLAPEKDPRTAAQNIVQKLKLQVIESGQVNVHGNPAFAMLSLLVQTDQNSGQQNRLKIMTYCIQYGGNVYVFHGVSAEKDFVAFQRLFQQTMEGFRQLNDPNKLNVKPERIKVVSVPKPMSLQQLFAANNMPSKRYNELAILNSMELSQQLKAGTLIKILSDINPRKSK